MLSSPTMSGEGLAFCAHRLRRWSIIGSCAIVASLTLSSVSAWASPVSQPQRLWRVLSNGVDELQGTAGPRRPGPSSGCRNDGDCDDGTFCNGQETCIDGECQAGTPVNCDDGLACTADFCSPGQDACTHLPNNALCNNQSFCDGLETCDPNVGCVAGDEPCDGLCDEGLNACVECLTNADCSDGVFCNGAEVCSPDGFCDPGSTPCAGSEFCSETQDACVECFNHSDCDDGQFCNGAETCNNGTCSAGSAPCNATETCNESQNACESNAGDEPTAEFVMSGNPVEIGDEITFTAMAPPGNVLYYMWEISGPRVCVDCIGEEVTVVYPEAGTYSATLMILFLDGNYLSTTQTFDVVHGLELVGMIDGIIGDVKDVTISATSQTAWMISDPARVVGVDIADPAAPTLAWDISDDITGAVMGINSENNTVAVAAGWGGAYVIDIESDGSAVTIHHIDTWGEDESTVWAASIIGDTLVLATSFSSTGETRIKSYDVSNRSNPTLLNSMEPVGSFIKGFHVDGDRLYARDEARPSIVVFDVANPAEPTQLGVVETPYFARDVDVQDGLLAVAAPPVELAMYDISNLNSPVPLSEYVGGLSGRSVALMGDKAYLGRSSAVFEFSIADPTDPIALENIQPFAGTGYNKTIKGVAIHDGMIFAPFAQGGLSVVDP